MEASGKIAVVGSTGRVGRHLFELLGAQGRDVVEVSRTRGVDVITGDGLADALSGVETVVDVASTPSPDEKVATEFFTTATRNLHEIGEQAGVRRMVVVSIIGCDRFSTGYNAAKAAHEREMLSGPIPAQILRAAQFHEFVEQMVEWGQRGDVIEVPKMRTQLVAAKTVAEALAELATGPAPESSAVPIPEIAGPRAERLVEIARLLVSRRGDSTKVEEVSDPDNPDGSLFAEGGLLPGPDATLAGPTYEEWLASR